MGDVRSFIMQEQWERDETALNKNDPVRAVLEGLDVILTDDSLIRGTNVRALVEMVRDDGEATEVHVRIGSPPTLAPCYLGIDMKSRGEFAAARAAERLGFNIFGDFADRTKMGLTKEQVAAVTEEVRKEIGADSLHYLSFEAMRKVLGSECCFGCWNPSLNPAELRADILDSIRKHPDGYRV
jgi:amidophosphoribosyltransferase